MIGRLAAGISSAQRWPYEHLHCWAHSMKSAHHYTRLTLFGIPLLLSATWRRRDYKKLPAALRTRTTARDTPHTLGARTGGGEDSRRRRSALRAPDGAYQPIRRTLIHVGRRRVRAPPPTSGRSPPICCAGADTCDGDADANAGRWLWCCAWASNAARGWTARLSTLRCSINGSELGRAGVVDILNGVFATCAM